MNVFKFGGASVNTAEGVKVLVNIVNLQRDNLIVVVSAMGKITNALEDLCDKYFYKKDGVLEAYNGILDFHNHIIHELFGSNDSKVSHEVGLLYDKLKHILDSEPSLSYDYEYDRIICFGELLSTTIVSIYMEKMGRPNKWMDIRKCLKTDENYRDANIDMKLSEKLCKKFFTFQDTFLYVTQGFIAGTSTNQTTSLGREGSDYTAAILANLLDAEDVTIWKDVPGIMNADPKLYSDTIPISKLSYKEAIELSHCGAKVIHPKTIKPLENKKIPLFVKSFLNPENHGTIIRELDEKLHLPPVFVEKFDQLLLTLTPRDFSFIAEEKLSEIFGIIAKYHFKLNLMQNSAISFSICLNNNKNQFKAMVDELMGNYEVLYNDNVRLLTIRHYNEEIIKKLVGDNIPYVEQRSRLTARFILVNDKKENNV